MSSWQKKKEKQSQEKLTTLKNLMAKAPNSIYKNNIRTIIDMYENNFIPNYKTAFNAVDALASNNKHVIKSKKPQHLFRDIKNKYLLKHQKFDMTLILYTELGGNDFDDDGNFKAQRGSRYYHDKLRQCHYGFHEVKMSF